ncbi:hypothetical protein C0992_003801 [Termitomyces sp. T32_za158]|nr:hypothetical protein C0992_003801 [Termitomyces sp. T32_za158]
MGSQTKTKIKIPTISWDENKHHLIWALLTEMEVPNNYKVLFGKKDKMEDPDHDDPALVPQISSEVSQLQESTPPPALTPQQSFGSDLLLMTNLSTSSSQDMSESPSPTKSSRSAKPSLVSREALQHAQTSISKAPPKQSLGDTLLEMQRKQFAMLQQKNLDELVIKKRGQLIEEYKLGIWTKEEYLEQVSALEPALKCQKRHHSSGGDEN